MKIAIHIWAERQFDPPPKASTLYLWAKEGRIVPAPIKIGRTYYVEPTAKHIAEVQRDTGLLGRLKAA